MRTLSSMKCQVFMVLVSLSSATIAEDQVFHLVAFGDSTTAARGTLKVYSQLLGDAPEFKKSEYSESRLKVTNAGVPGDHTERARKRFEKDVLKRKPDIVVIQFGINDSAVDVWKKTPATSPRVSKEAYRKNLEYFIDELNSRKVTVILMTSNPLSWTPQLRMLYGKPPYHPEDEDGFNVLLEEYADVCRSVAKESSVPLIDVYQVFQKENLSDLLLDGMHPNEKGHRLVAKHLLPVLIQVLK